MSAICAPKRRLCYLISQLSQQCYTSSHKKTVARKWFFGGPFSIGTRTPPPTTMLLEAYAQSTAQRTYSEPAFKRAPSMASSTPLLLKRAKGWDGDVHLVRALLGRMLKSGSSPSYCSIRHHSALRDSGPCRAALATLSPTSLTEKPYGRAETTHKSMELNKSVS
jgi:hypothetical protein